MANNWKIPASLEREIRERDIVCVYCSVEFTLTKISKKLRQAGNILLMTPKSLQEKILLYVAVVAT